MHDPVFIELIGDGDGEADVPPRPPSSIATVLTVVAAIVLVAGAVSWLVGGGSDRPERDGERPESEMSGPRISPARRAAESYLATPGGARLRQLFESIGGFAGLQMAVAEGAFDVVTFDPLDGDRLLAARRAGYGDAQNQDVNQQWLIQDGNVVQSAWDPNTEHDFVHFNTDGTITMWVHSGDEIGFAPRNAVVIDRDGTEITTSSSAIYADRFAVDAGTIFALTGKPDWYTLTTDPYISLLADDGERQTWLAPGRDFSWIDVPTTGLLVAYPAGPTGLTAAWDSHTLEPLENHPLAGRPYQRVAVSGDGTTALGVTHDGELERIELVTGRVVGRFGQVDVTEVGHPIALSRDGTLAITVERSGTVSIWFVADGTLIAEHGASAGVTGLLSTARSARPASSIAQDANRLALRIPALPQIRLSWSLIDTDIESWLIRACDMGGRPSGETCPSCVCMAGS